MSALEQLQSVLAVLSSIKDMPLNRESCKYNYKINLKKKKKNYFKIKLKKKINI